MCHRGLKAQRVLCYAMPHCRLGHSTAQHMVAQKLSDFHFSMSQGVHDRTGHASCYSQLLSCSVRLAQSQLGRYSYKQKLAV